jgi:serine/threonine-protein kinase
MALTPGTRLGSYDIVSALGAGGMGVVFRARDTRIGRDVAIKLLGVPDESLRDRLLQEAQSVGGLAHRNIVTILDVGEHEGQSYIVMEFVEGVTLAEQIHDNVPIPVWRKIEIVEELSSGLDYAHNKGIVHSDIKPANVMIDRDGVVKILDFGMARLGHITMTQAGMMLGTPNYMSPEQFESGPVDRRSDIFSVGVLFYELLTYRKAFSGQQPSDVMKAVLGKRPVPLRAIMPGIDPAVEAAVNRALEKNPTNRYQTLAELNRDLAEVTSRGTSDVASPSASPVTPLPDTLLPTMARSSVPHRHAERIDEYLNAARRAFDRGEYGTAMAACQDAELLDPDDGRVRSLLEQSRAALDRQHTAEILSDARGALARGDVTQASTLIAEVLQLDSASGEARALNGLRARVGSDRWPAAIRHASIARPSKSSPITALPSSMMPAIPAQSLPRALCSSAARPVSAP